MKKKEKKKKKKKKKKRREKKKRDRESISSSNSSLDSLKPPGKFPTALPETSSAPAPAPSVAC
jgi:hypothetical protein